MNVQVTNNIKPLLNKQKKQIAKLPDEAYKFFVKETPIRSGNARRNTRLRKNVINADYPYAQRLDEGYSKQSPQGMTQPTLDFVAERFNKIMSGK